MWYDRLCVDRLELATLCYIVAGVSGMLQGCGMIGVC